VSDRLPRRGRKESGAAFGLGLFAAIQTFYFFARRDRFAVLFWWTRESWLLVALLWAKNLVLAGAAFFVFKWIARTTMALPEPAEKRPDSVGRHAFVFAGILMAGVALRWIAPRQIPPGVWVDVLHEAEGALREPWRISLLGGRPLDIEGMRNSTLVSNLYLSFCASILRIFGRGDLGILALSAFGGTLSLPAGYWMAKEMGGNRRALIAMALFAFAAWPLIFSRWGWTLALLLPLVLGAAAAVMAALRTGKVIYSAVAGALVGLSLHTHAAGWAAAAGFGVFALQIGRHQQHRRLVAVAALACVLAFLPYALGFIEYPDHLGGRTRDVSLLGPPKDPTIPGASGPLAVPIRFLYNAVEYTGILLWTSDPNPRDRLPGGSPVHPLIGIAALVGAAVGWRQARQGNKGQLLVWLIAGSSLFAGLLASPGGAPNVLRIFPVVGAVVLWSAAALGRWIPAAARAVSAREGFVWAFSLVLLFVVETTRFLTIWPEDGWVISSFCPDESAAGRLRRALGKAPTVLDPTALSTPIVFETLAAGADPRVPIPKLPQRDPADLLADPPDEPFWYITTGNSLQRLRNASWRCSRGVAPREDLREMVISRVIPPSADFTQPANSD
jgi:hypothetical protein